jgi:hypothetical protein
MKSLQAYIFLLTGFLAVSPRAEAGNDPARSARKADSLVMGGDHYTASIYYRKAAFFSDAPVTAGFFLVRAAESLAETRRYNESIEVLNSINTAGLPDSLTFRVKYTAALYAYLNSEFSLAQNFLLQARYLITDSLLIYQTYLLEALSMHEQYRWAEARQLVLQLNSFVNRTENGLRQAKETEINELYGSQSLPHIRNKKKAVRMSTFFPGLGQTYAGYPAEGALSFCSIAATSAVALYGLLNQYYFTSFVLGNYIVGKFYQGGLARTEFLIDKRNYVRSHGFNKALRIKLLAMFPERG